MVLILCAGVKKADEGLGFIFSGLGGGGVSCSWWLQANKQISNKDGTMVLKKGFMTVVWYGK